MKSVLFLVGLIVVVVGAVWVAEGMGYWNYPLPYMPAMFGVKLWAYFGGALAALGILIVLDARREAAPLRGDRTRKSESIHYQSSKEHRMPGKVWFITGASRGFGRIWAEAALKRGDKVAATARTLADVADLKERFGDAVLPLALDVTNADQARHAIAQAHAHFGRLDVVLNNAGYTLVGTVEEANEADIRALFDTNFFGTLRVIQAALPLLRQQGSGHILGVSSSLGIVPMPLIGFYCATKAAIESLHESLAPEVKPFGIKVTLLEPGAYATDFGSPASLKIVPGMDAYAELRKRVSARLSGADRGDPQATAEAILKIVDAEQPPLRFIFGSTVLPMARAAYADRVATWEAWEAVSNAAQGEPRKGTVASF